MDGLTTASLPELATTHRTEVAELRNELATIRSEMMDIVRQRMQSLKQVNEQHTAAAQNLLAYLALRTRDLRTLQPRLTALGLSSLGRSEGLVLPAIESVERALGALSRCEGVVPYDTAASDRCLAENTQSLLGEEPSERRVRIMVTMPSEAAQDYSLVHELVRAGMDCMRINCAHDDARAWSQMIRNLQQANRSLGRSCKVAMDLAGPKLRTGPLQSGPPVMKFRPERDRRGRVIAPARIWLRAGGQAAPSPCAGELAMPRKWLSELKRGDRIRFHDLRDSRREWLIADTNADGVWAEANETCYVAPGISLKHVGARSHGASARVRPFPGEEEPIVLEAGSKLTLMRTLEPGRGAVHDSAGRVLTPAFIGCTLPEVFDAVRAGERIWFDDGLIGGVINSVATDRISVTIDRVRPGGAKLRGDKGINLPESTLNIPALTAKDLQDLDFVVAHADLVSLSFVNQAADVELLQKHLRERNGEHLGIILKVETRRGFEALPEALLAALRSRCCGVMIARGDLAVECGFERLAELQEEILWICEAARVPVIWATQVLESLAKEGIPSRAEITDAAMSERAECVMLNKGPHIVEAVTVLDDILRRMQAHVTKKRPMLRELKLAQRFLDHAPASAPGNGADE
jgi:pyruvate kinase